MNAFFGAVFGVLIVLLIRLARSSACLRMAADPPTLRIREDAEPESRVLGPVACWRAFCGSSYGARGGASMFSARYAAYGHYRRQGWVVRSAQKYGAEYALYRGTPDEVHAGRCVVLCRALGSVPDHSGTPAHDRFCGGVGSDGCEARQCEARRSGHGRGTSGDDGHYLASKCALRAQPTWKEVQAWSRVLTGVAKRLVLCCLHVPTSSRTLGGAGANKSGSSCMPDALRLQLQAEFGSLPSVAAELLVTPTRNESNLNGDQCGTPKRERTKATSKPASSAKTAGKAEAPPRKKRRQMT